MVLSKMLENVNSTVDKNNCGEISTNNLGVYILYLKYILVWLGRGVSYT